MAERRRDDAWLAEIWADPRSRVFAVEKGQALVQVQDVPSLVLVPAAELTETGERYLMGVDTDGVAYFAVSGALPVIEGAERADLRQIGALLNDRDSGLLTHAVALEHWHATHQHCPRCGARTELAAAGHVRVCPVDGSEHFPRLDPAVIMLITDAADRILLARGPAWPEAMRSVLAGFVEPGESLEQAVAREVHEEVGLVVHDIRYVGSQPWPLPQSLMLGFFCRVDESATPSEDLRPDPTEILDAAWYTREEFGAAVQAGEIMAPGRLSIASRMISRWYGGEVSRFRGSRLP
ncbi:NAD(+) diphosphatase [Actinomadura scrupuli]|uniref:NAD(+) diphosphatase n=1 Tax=Actinomadura scrupuli TaxID=559629 RepID=UPI003D97753C